MTPSETLERARALDAVRKSTYRLWRDAVDTLWDHFSVPAHIEEQRTKYEWCEAFDRYRGFLIEVGASNLAELERRASAAVTVTDNDGEAD